MDYQSQGFPKGIASFTKGLNHNNMGEVLNPADFDQFLNAIQDSLNDIPNYTNSLSFFESIPIASGIPANKPKAKLVNPVCGLSYDSEGLDAFNRTILPAPRIDSLNVGDDVGPYLSQFMLRGNKDEPIRRNYKDGYVKYGTTSIDQRHVVAKEGTD